MTPPRESRNDPDRLLSFEAAIPAAPDSVRQRSPGDGSGRGVGVIDIDGYGACIPIGRGGVGEVYRSTRLSTGAVVAIKVLHHVSDESTAWRRTRRELAAMVALSGHAHVIGVIEVLDLPTGPALVMEYAPGGSVGDVMAQRAAPLEIGEAILIGEHAAKALIAAHARGIVHRDVKPHNLLIDAFGQVKLCDFGIAALARSDEFRAHTNAVSLRYASPEDLEGDEAVAASTDIYSLGATLLHMVHGAPPSLRDRLTSWEPPAAASDSDLAAINSVIVECLQIDPAKRPSASEVFDLLEHLPWSGVDRRRAIIGSPPSLDVSRHRRPVHPSDDPRSVDVIALNEVGAQESAESAESSESAGFTIPRPTPRPVASVSHAAPRPVPVPRWQRRAFLVAPVVAMALVGALFVWQRTRPTEAVSLPTAVLAVVERPDDLTDLTQLTWPTGAVGECLVQPARGDMLEPIDCFAPHDLQRLSSGQLSAAIGVTSGDLVSERCSDAWEALVQRRQLVLPPDVADVLQLSNVRPSDASAAPGPTYQCFVGVPGSRLRGDLVGAELRSG